MNICQREQYLVGQAETGVWFGQSSGAGLVVPLQKRKGKVHLPSHHLGLIKERVLMILSSGGHEMATNKPLGKGIELACLVPRGLSDRLVGLAEASDPSWMHVLSCCMEVFRIGSECTVVLRAVWCWIVSSERAVLQTCCFSTSL